MNTSSLAALNRQLLTTPHFGRRRLLENFQDPLLITRLELRLLRRTRINKLLCILWVISVITIVKQLLRLQVNFIQIIAVN